MAPISAAGIVMRSPATTNGMAFGSTTFRNTAAGVAPMTRTTFTRPPLTVPRPAIVLRYTTKNTKVAARMTLGKMPMPNHRIISGASAIFGVA